MVMSTMRVGMAIAGFLLAFLGPESARAQWEVEESHTTADLRGVISVGGGVAWASGTNGTVLRTEDGGFVWQGCAVPPGAEALDLRGMEAFNEQTAIVMSSGPGDRSRLYRTDDGCLTWRLLKTNSDLSGFWDAVRFTDRGHGMVLGDPVGGRFVLLRTGDGGATWTPVAGEPADEAKDQGAFAASNSALLVSSGTEWSFCTGGAAGPHVWRAGTEFAADGVPKGSAPVAKTASVEELVSTEKTETAGCFSMAQRGGAGGPIVAVGGDYKRPEATGDTAWATAAAAGEGGAAHPDFRFGAAKVGPGGYRSSVDWDPEIKAWVAVGPTGTDVSTDDGVTWRALRGAATGGWNAVSGPFAVGPKGRVGRLRRDALHPAEPEAEASGSKR